MALRQSRTLGDRSCARTRPTGSRSRGYDRRLSNPGAENPGCYHASQGRATRVDASGRAAPTPLEHRRRIAIRGPMGDVARNWARGLSAAALVGIAGGFATFPVWVLALVSLFAFS